MTGSATKECPHCRTVVDRDAAVCSGCGTDLAPAAPSSSLPAVDARALVLWGGLVVPGLVLVLLGVLVLESTPLLVAGLVALAIPLLLQLFGGSWRGVG